ncbi:uncharacterized protein A4U43_C04F32970 [Asparagus officinalis]|uniref:Uncharacterized protein n=2 Tax=Asparagus officinalis TaxID=4686 RepID=A0A5P1F5B8_ASPOF|nr:uncharacterized protein A4U43_C04F32970 [Asparagus officinalis]
MRKGPWMAEEDEILLDYVKKHGPRDWSSIRSKGLLPRTGKSCRLRWVNKLKPDLKTGCKFSPEEERIVIELQARFGNKWARIATYLPGRTDNDVKNFWSTRQKRLARSLQKPLPSKSNKNQGEIPSLTDESPTFEVSLLDLYSFEEESQSIQDSQTSYTDNQDAATMIQTRSLPPNQDLTSPHNLTPPLIEPLEWKPPTQLDFEHFSDSALDFPLLFDTPELIPGHGSTSFQQKFAWQDKDSSFMQLPESLPPFDKNNIKIERDLGTQYSFDDFPVDMFDYADQPGPPTSPAAW